ncbi:hypothetical protein M409DRAFT_59626 [Zasmidium cellare ATCC 36951]|uniref:Uncharacterized protein n=1 Tax=Zasmidium cellare ATCC 36951 TaxID=1080233 RepID=A0A6A6C3H2_ZASCE|nr:uncharacterized protein M409DRAFT_59626 [Zasmidium cellare ATCC 36951]KAF2160838.1 hypothetical protein M409DRAFT_59626 [Zasmidium cellare ATCC 36951]
MTGRHGGEEGASGREGKRGRQNVEAPMADTAGRRWMEGGYEEDRSDGSIAPFCRRRRLPAHDLIAATRGDALCCGQNTYPDVSQCTVHSGTGAASCLVVEVSLSLSHHLALSRTPSTLPARRPFQSTAVIDETETPPPAPPRSDQWANPLQSRPRGQPWEIARWWGPNETRARHPQAQALR